MNPKRGTGGSTLASLRNGAGLAAAAALAGAMALAAQALSAELGPLLVQADEITYDTATGLVTARGHVEISADSRTLLADQVTYDENTGVVSASGNVSLQDERGNVAFADHVELSGDLREGALEGFAALIGETVRVAAASGERREGRFTIARAAVFTPCAICEEEGERRPLWQIRAGRIVHDELAREVYFEDATFEFLGTSVLFLPVFSQPDPSVTHRTGFLLPDAGTISTIGSFVKIPYYISLSESRDLTFSPFITAEAGSVMQAEYRERFRSGGLWFQGTLGYDSGARDRPGKSVWMSSLFGSGRIPIADGWRAGFDVQLASNKSYLRRYELSYLDRLTTSLFTDAVRGRSRAGLTGYFFQSLRDLDVPGEMPLALPLIEYTHIPEYDVWGGRLRVDTSALYLTRKQGTDMLRGSAAVDWRFAHTTDSGQLITFQNFLRGDLYYVEEAQFSAPGAGMNTETIGRALGFGMIEWRWPFVGDIDLPGSTLVVEPIAQLVAASGGGNPRGLPNEDSTAFEFDITNLFSPNPSPGLDLWAGGPRSNMGVRASALLPKGSVEATLGQSFRFDTDSSLPPGLRLNEDKSDVVGQFKMQFPPNLSLIHQFNIDPDDGTIRRNEVYLRARFGNSLIDLSYLKLPVSAADPTLGEQEQINLATSLQLFGFWGIFGTARRDLAKGQNLESSIGITYSDECFVASLGFHRRDTATLNLKPSSAVIFRLGFKTGATGA